MIKFNGLYETKCEYEEDNEEGTQGYLRFYSNGKVISASTECEATALDLKDWFNLEMEYLSIGNYKLNGQRIRFSTTSRNGKVNYKGQINKDGTLKLKSKSLINGYKSREEYLFVKVSGLK
ncbi:hypothetical protein [Aquimarina sediminis]|uniref:hypothetical protein n=1 Tax=Aquimarina sediminis TaxID=2070536 RepID=UPI000CA019AF|nr:hypothetical protein [Aquimarina sediminis]